MVIGFILSFAGLIGWSWFAGINIFIALVFFGIYLLTSLVLTRTAVGRHFIARPANRGRTAERANAHEADTDASSDACKPGAPRVLLFHGDRT